MEPCGTTRRLMDVGTETGAAVLEQELKVIVRTTDPSQHENPLVAFGAFKRDNLETHEKMNKKTNSAVMECDGNPDEIPSVAVELL